MQEIGQRFRLAPKTVDNTLQRMARAAKPEICRVPKKRGHYKLAPRLSANVSLNRVSQKEEVQGKTPVRESVSTIPRGLGTGYSDRIPSNTQYQGGRYLANSSDELRSDPLSPREVEMDISGTIKMHPSLPPCGILLASAQEDSREFQLAMDGIGSGAEVFVDGDDPHWPKRSSTA